MFGEVLGLKGFVALTKRYSTQHAHDVVAAHPVARGNESARNEQRGSRGRRRNDAQGHHT
jgi:hypothetical protein